MSGIFLRRAARAVVLSAVLSICVLSPGTAAASRTESTIFDATNSLLSAPTDAKRNETLNRLDSFGVDTLRLVLPWRFLVPAPGKAQRPADFNPANPHDYPAFRWGATDATVLGAEKRGMRVLLTPASPFPSWATQSGSSRLRDPKPSEFRSFLVALGRRYGGDFRVDPGKQCTPIPIVGCTPQDPSPQLPRVDFWSLLNEPNQDLFLQPQRRNGRPYSPRLYRRLFLAGQAGLAASGHAKDTLLIGETAPSGGLHSLDPLDFMRGVLCLTASYHHMHGCKPIHASGWAHHPYSPGVAPFRLASNPGLINFDNIGTMTRGLRRAAAAGATTRRLPLYVTEFGVQSVPDRRAGVSLSQQVAYLAIAEYLSWSNRSIRSYAQYLLRDDSLSQSFAFTTGLQRHSGRPKPSQRSFPMTLMVKRNGGHVLIWGHVRPATQRTRVTIRFRNGSGPARILRSVPTDRNGYFHTRSAFRAGRNWSASCSLPGNRKLQGPFVPAYSF